jgi:O2-independent ubiquinone biosynthesis accessory factor UbiT
MHRPAPTTPQRVLRPLVRVARATARHVPERAQRIGVEIALSRILGPQLHSDDLDFLRGRTLCIEVKDLGWRWPLTATGSSLICLPADAPADATIRGPSRSFMALALRRTDPDTLFFNRELVIEGDTELGLAAKNLLDSVDWDRLRWLPKRFRTPRNGVPS